MFCKHHNLASHFGSLVNSFPSSTVHEFSCDFDSPQATILLSDKLSVNSQTNTLLAQGIKCAWLSSSRSRILEQLPQPACLSSFSWKVKTRSELPLNIGSLWKIGIYSFGGGSQSKSRRWAVRLAVLPRPIPKWRTTFSILKGSGQPWQSSGIVAGLLNNRSTPIWLELTQTASHKGRHSGTQGRSPMNLARLWTSGARVYFQLRRTARFACRLDAKTMWRSPLS